MHLKYVIIYHKIISSKRARKSCHAESNFPTKRKTKGIGAIACYRCSSAIVGSNVVFPGTVRREAEVIVEITSIGCSGIAIDYSLGEFPLAIQKPFRTFINP